jgi:glycosyltransferase involved in cell wall biosynthesis
LILKKVVIITRSFPPVNKTASMRPLAWAKYMNKFGYKPVIITRNWDREIKVEEDVNFPSGKKVKHISFDEYEVYYVPFSANLNYRLINTFGRVRGTSRLFRKIQKTIGHFFIFNPYKKLYKFAKSYLKTEDVHSFILTVPPFKMLELGYKLNKSTGVKWIADFRDEWHTSDMTKVPRKNYKGIFKNLKHFCSPDSYRQEKKWTSNCFLFTTVSPSGVEKMESFLGIDGRYLPNGFFKDDFKEVEKPELYDHFTITYAGWLYGTQQIEVLLSAFKNIYARDNSVKLKLLLVGGKSFRGVEKRMKELTIGFEHMVELTDRVSKSNSIAMQLKSHLLLLCSHKNAKGIPSSKLYEYIGLRKSVLACPGDDGIIDETLKEMQNGFICNSVEETEELILRLMKEYKEIGGIHISFQEDKRLNYSREKQTEDMCNLLNSM